MIPVGPFQLSLCQDSMNQKFFYCGIFLQRRFTTRCRRLALPSAPSLRIVTARAIVEQTLLLCLLPFQIRSDSSPAYGSGVKKFLRCLHLNFMMWQTFTRWSSQIHTSEMPTEMSLFILKETDSLDKGKEGGSENNEKIITIIIHKN